MWVPSADDDGNRKDKRMNALALFERYRPFFPCAPGLAIIAALCPICLSSNAGAAYYDEARIHRMNLGEIMLKADMQLSQSMIALAVVASLSSTVAAQDRTGTGLHDNGISRNTGDRPSSPDFATR